MSYRQFSQIKLSGVAAAVPNSIKYNSDLEGNTDEIQKTSKVVGIESRYIASKNICTSDLCFAAAEDLLNQLGWERDSVDALIFLSQTPDYLLPATSCVLQKKLNLSTNCAAFDMTLGCSGYIYGLLTAYSLISSKGIKRVLLLVGDTISKVLSPHDMPANVLFGDAGTATAIEFDASAGDSYISVGTDGSGANSLIIEAGGFRKPTSAETTIRKSHKKDGVLRAEEELFMDGSAVFGFTLLQIPKFVKSLLDLSKQSPEEIDYWFFHQANKFMLDHLAKKIGILPEKMMMNMHKFGNTSPPSIPLLLVSEHLKYLGDKKSKKIGLVGFGVGFSWGGALLEVNNMVIPPLRFIDNKGSDHVS